MHVHIAQRRDQNSAAAIELARRDRERGIVRRERRDLRPVDQHVDSIATPWPHVSDSHRHSFVCRFGFAVAAILFGQVDTVAAR